MAGKFSVPDAVAAWLVVVAIAATVAALLSALPTPRELWDAPVAAGLSTQVDRAAMIAAAVLTWILATWLAGVLMVAIAARLFLSGRRGRLVVTRLARLLLPRALRSVVLTAVGVGSLAAAAGCAPTAAAGGFGAGSLPGPSASAAASTTGIPLTVDLDWPLDPPPAGPTVVAPPPVTADVAPVAVDDTAAASPVASPGPTSGATTEAPRSDGVTSDVPGASTASTAPLSTTGPAGDTREVTTATTPTTPPPVPGQPAASATTAASAADVPTPSVPAADPAPGPPVSAPVSPAPAAGHQGPVDDVQAPEGSDGSAAAIGHSGSAVAEQVSDATVTVAPGDSLWSLAAAHLPADASATDIAAAWPDWYAANRAVIGDDPDHIEPGWPLTVPSDREDS